MTTQIDDFKTRETKRMPTVKVDEPKTKHNDEIPAWADWGDEP